jgi:trk system potassium uptake protein
MTLETWIDLIQAQVRERHGVTVVGIKRPNEAFTYAQPSSTVQPDDLLIVIGEMKAVERFAART